MTRRKPETVGHATEEDYVYVKFKQDFSSKRGKSITGQKDTVKRVHKSDIDKAWIDEDGPCKLVKRPKDFAVEDHDAAGGETADDDKGGNGNGAGKE